MNIPVAGNKISTQDYFINIGPQHPSTHGVLHLVVKLDGEIVCDIESKLGYIHRSIEKICEKQTYRQFIHLTSRMDYLSAHINNQACALAIEKALQVEVPPKAQTVRVLLAELTRLASHQLWWGVMGMDLGAVTPFFYGWRDREIITDIFEQNCGTRLTMNYIVPGGIMEDIHAEFVKNVKNFLDDFKPMLEEYDNLLTNNSIFIERTKNVGNLKPTDAIAFGCSGPVARGSGISCDIRKWHPYDGYDKINFQESLEYDGDCYARYMVRMKEMRESISIIEKLIDNIPEGIFQAKMKKVIKLPEGEYYQRVETARGEFAVFIVSDGKDVPYRVKFRSPGFSNLSALRTMAMGGKIADLVAILAALDLVIPDIDR